MSVALLVQQPGTRDTEEDAEVRLRTPPQIQPLPPQWVSCLNMAASSQLWPPDSQWDPFQKRISSH